MIMISCVKSSKSGRVDSGEILNDNRRLNVAMTRSRKKLIVIGSRSTLSNYKPFESFFASLKDCQFLKV